MNLPLEMFIYLKPSISGSSGLRIRGVGRGGHRGHVPPQQQKNCFKGPKVFLFVMKSALFVQAIDILYTVH